jgi:NADPH-dependent curcumin reductase CurA
LHPLICDVLLLQGKIKVQETVRNGFEKMPEAFIELLEGKNTGKMVIKA